MKHQFEGGPLGGKVLLLDVLLSDGELRHDVPWEEYVKVGEERTDDNTALTLIKWKCRSDVTDEEYPTKNIPGGSSVVDAAINQLIDPIHQAHPARIVPHIEDIPVPVLEQHREAIQGATPVHEVATEVPEIDSEDTAVESRVDIQPSNSVSSEGIDIEAIWRTFEERRKRLKISRDRLGTDLGHTKSLGWRLESGNVTDRDAKKIELENIDAVYLAADALIQRWEAGNV